MAVKTSWAAGDVLTAADLTDTFAAKAATTSVGLIKISSQTVSGVSSISFNNVFTSTYRNYRMVAWLIDTTAINWWNFRFRASGSDNTTANYGYVTVQTATNATPTRQTNNGLTGFDLLGLYGNRGWMVSMDIFNPQDANYTNISGIGSCRSTDTAINNMTTFGGGFNAATQFDGFTIGNLGSSSGLVSVYAYN